MTTSELTQRLATYSPDTLVLIYDRDGAYYFEAGVGEAQVAEVAPGTYQRVAHDGHALRTAVIIG